ncbi:hypothetical protein [Syntrophaceticus schinkii]|uniref:hypothetical protein n=1 Tax=Syntrophaceticus schinkii TaxID=499207 RepID=UPI0012EC0564|nr:hypothetical protein [Syntrophaceticus schinkii]
MKKVNTRFINIPFNMKKAIPKPIAIIIIFLLSFEVNCGKNDNIKNPGKIE